MTVKINPRETKILGEMMAPSGELFEIFESLNCEGLIPNCYWEGPFWIRVISALIELPPGGVFERKMAEYSWILRFPTEGEARDFIRSRTYIPKIDPETGMGVATTERMTELFSDG